MMKISIPKPKEDRAHPAVTLGKLAVAAVVLALCIPLAPKVWHNPFIQDMVSTTKDFQPEVKPIKMKEISEQMRPPTAIEKDAHGYNNLGGSKTAPNKKSYEMN